MKRYYIEAKKEDPVTKEKWVEIWTRLPNIGIRRLNALDQKDWLKADKASRQYIESKKDADDFVQRMKIQNNDTSHYADIQVVTTKL